MLVFSGAGCLGPSVVQGTPQELASPGLSVHVPDESTAQFSALVETHYNSSPCSAPISYTNSTKVKDEAPPADPTLNSTTPASPANENHPKIVGSAEAGSSLTIYTGPKCQGDVVANGTAEELASPGITVPVADNSVNQFSATATDAADNISLCSQEISYTEISPDETAPAAPLLTSTSPASPANEWHPRIIGSAEAGSSVTIFDGASCAGTIAGSGSASQLSAGGIQVTVQAETTAQFSATATDVADNTSPCSEPISYTNTAVIGPSTVTVFIPAAEGPPPPSCEVPKLAGLTLAKARSALTGAGCALGKVTKPKPRKGKKLGALVVKSSTPGAGASTTGTVALKLGPKPKKRSH